MGHSTVSGSIEQNAALFIQKIKKSTEELHVRLESQALLSALMTPSVTKLQYYYYLFFMKIIEEEYETKIINMLETTLPAQEAVKASKLIADDLGNIHVNAAERPVNDYTIPTEKLSIPFALGFMYVMEGSKLGGKVIYKHIHRALGYAESCGAEFIADYGNDTFSSWKEFLFNLSAYIAQNNCEEEAIHGAEYAFSSIYDFFESNRVIYED